MSNQSSTEAAFRHIMRQDPAKSPHEALHDLRKTEMRPTKEDKPTEPNC